MFPNETETKRSAKLVFLKDYNAICDLDNGGDMNMNMKSQKPGIYIYIVANIRPILAILSH